MIPYTLADGVQPVFATHLKCRTCHTSYHYDYAVTSAIDPVTSKTYYNRYYYKGSPPDVIQVGEHYFIGWKLVELLINLVLLACSVSNFFSFHALHDFADAVHSGRRRPIMRRSTTIPLPNPNAMTLRRGHSASIFERSTCGTLSLYVDRAALLTLPHDGDQKDRFTEAMRARNDRNVLFGQLEWSHACKKCVKSYVDDKGVMSKSYKRAAVAQ